MCPWSQVYGYNIPDNMYLWGSLSRLLKLNAALWQDPRIQKTAELLMQEVHAGIMGHGVTQSRTGTTVYAYEVDGLGNTLTDFDDPNLPSLLAMPLLGYSLYNKELYQATRARILSPANAFYFKGSQLSGLGSPHTQHQYVWPLATAVDALTTTNMTRQLELLAMLLKMAEGNGLVHESVHVDRPGSFSRAEFGWANAMTVVMVEQLLGVDCDAEAEEFRLRSIAERESKERTVLPNHDVDGPKYYEQLEAGIQHAAG
jgi:meiotically up-regulated gene 157 (Mug157) protein